VSNANWEQVKDIFASALEVSASKRNAFVAEKCGNDSELRAEVESWLASYSESEDFIETPAFSHHEITGNSEPAAGRQFGNYRVIREIGHGGMGAVFLAERTDGEFSQQVAIKIIRQSMAESEIVNRFKRERQILATLNHPNIARLLDGGVTEDGLPFLAMEFVDGESITKFCELQNLDLESRLTLFLKVCSAISYAHRNLIVHRDLKPSNILVTADGEPKLLDFGLAKLLDENLSSDSTQTQTAFRALTPSYASPEQLKNEPMTTSSDIYSLGVVLYELLTNERPFRFEDKSFDEIIKTVTLTEPPPPSANPLSAIRNTQLAGDLDNITLMALRKEPERRYQSVEVFADDIERYLKGLPVSARPNTLQYRSAKFVKRHKFGIASAVLILLILLGGIVSTIRQSERAQRERDKAKTINIFLSQMLNYSDPRTAIKKSENELITIKDVLDKAAKQIENEDFSTQPDVLAQLNYIIGNSYYTQGFYESAEKHSAIALTQQTNISGWDSPETVEIKLSMASIFGQRAKRTEADELFRETLPSARIEFQKGNLKGVYLLTALHDFAVTRRALGNSKEAEDLLREGLVLEPFVLEKERGILTVIRGTLVLTLFDQGKLDEAIATQYESVSELRRSSAADTWEFGYALTALGGLLSERQNFAEADENLSKGEAIYRQLVGNSHLFLSDNLRIQANSLYQQNRFADATNKIDEALKIYIANTGPEYINFGTALVIRGLILNKTGKSLAAEKILREAFGLRERNLPPTHFLTAMAKGALGECLSTQKRFAEAEPLLIESFESLSRSQGERNPRTEIARGRLVNLYNDWHKFEIAAQYTSASGGQ